MRNLHRSILLAALAVALAGPLAAQTIKLGSLAPEGSPWDSTLKQMGAEWSRLSGGRIQLRIYPGGIAGDEQDMVRKMRIRQLDAAALTGIGVSPSSSPTSWPSSGRCWSGPTPSWTTCWTG